MPGIGGLRSEIQLRRLRKVTVGGPPNQCPVLGPYWESQANSMTGKADGRLLTILIMRNLRTKNSTPL